MALCFDVVPDVFEFAVGADEKRASYDAKERTAKKFLHAARAVGLDGLEIRIAEEIEVEFLLGFETCLGFDGVAAHAEDDHANFIELLFCVAKLGRLNASARGVGLRIEEQHHAFAAEVGERNIVAGVVF